MRAFFNNSLSRLWMYIHTVQGCCLQYLWFLVCNILWYSRCQILHARNHKSEIILENATASPLGHSRATPRGKWQSFGKYHWQMNVCSKMSLTIHWNIPLKIRDDFWGVDFWCAIFWPSRGLEGGPGEVSRGPRVQVLNYSTLRIDSQKKLCF